MKRNKIFVILFAVGLMRGRFLKPAVFFMKKFVRSIIFLFSLFFLISTAFSCQKKMHSQINEMVSYNEEILFPLTLDSIDYFSWHDFNIYSDDDSSFSNDDSIIFSSEFAKLSMLVISSFFILVTISCYFTVRNKYNKITLRKSTVF